MEAKGTKTKNDRSKAKELALELFLSGDYDQKQIADLVRVTERTITSWSTSGDWKKQRALRQTTPAEIESDIIEVIGGVMRDIKKESDPKVRLALADQLSKYNKTWENLKKDSRSSMTVYTTIMKEFIAFVQKENSTALPSLLSLQKEFINSKADDYL